MVSSDYPIAGDEADLLTGLRRRDEASFEQIVRAHRRDLYRVAYRILGSHEDADEAIQEAFIRAWRALPGFRGEAALKTWLTRIVINVARSARAPRRDHRELEHADSVADSGVGSDDAIARRQVSERVRSAVSRLPPRQREAVWLRVFGEMTYREASDVMGLTAGAVKAHVHQAVSNLRRLLMERTETR